MDSNPAFLQGIFSFEGQGLETPGQLDGASYTVPATRRAQLIYFRAGHSADELINLVLLRDGKPMRYFPLGSRDAMHVPLMVVEDLNPESRIELQVAAPNGTSGTVVVDLGFMEIA
jgi:assimilatory nitrate reductase catalytic subunit